MSHEAGGAVENILRAEGYRDILRTRRNAAFARS
jgi:hypothetical protein